MNNLKLISKGFLISFIGSLPMGYLNSFGLIIYMNNTIKQLFLFLIGICSIELLLLLISFSFINKITHNIYYKKYFELYSIFFLLIITIYFYLIECKSPTELNFKIYNNYFLTGMYLNAINLAQIPFWIGWILFLFKEKIEISFASKTLFVMSAVTGTFLAMFLIIYLCSRYFSKIYLNYLLSNLWILFFIMFVIAIYKYIKK